MLEWAKSTIKDMRKYRRGAKKARGGLGRKKAKAEARRVQARLEAERARLMELSEKELLVETLMTLRAYGAELTDLRLRLRGRLDILERNVDEVAGGMVNLELGMSCLDFPEPDEN